MRMLGPTLGRLVGVRWWRRGASLLAVALSAASCGLFEELPPLPTPGPSPANVVANPGFEDGDVHWHAREQPEWTRFTITDSIAHTGTKSMRMELTGDASATRTHITGAIQNLNSPLFPEFVSGFYRVEAWEPNATYQYLQFVIAIHGGDWADDFDVHEIRFPIVGVDQEPFRLSNSRFVFLDRSQPQLDEWVYFAYPVRQAFQTRHAFVPTTWERIDLYLEVRYDGKTEEQGETSAVVYYDDIYVGPQLRNTNHPDYED